MLLILQIAWYAGIAGALAALILLFISHELALNTMDRGLSAWAVLVGIPGRLHRSYKYQPAHAVRAPASRNWTIRSL
jgi:hypothetical protein